MSSNTPWKRTAPNRRSHAAGFTLIELLLALAMFAVIASVVFAAFAGVMNGVERGQQSMEVYRVGRAALHRMTQEIAAALWFPPNSQEPDDTSTTLIGKHTMADGRGRDRIMFATVPYRRFLDNVPADELCDISYYIADNGQRQNALFREEDCTPDKERESGGTRMELTDMATALNITYYDAKNNASEEWPAERDDSEHKLPCRVHIALTIQDAQLFERSFITTVSLPMAVAKKWCEEQ